MKRSPLTTPLQSDKLGRNEATLAELATPHDEQLALGVDVSQSEPTDLARTSPSP